jgi:MFS superfamily sulfate permease-like transporter
VLITQIIFIEQLVPMLGLAAILAHPEAKAEPPNSPLEKLLFVIDHVDHINKTTMTLALASLGFLIFVRSIKPRLMTRPGAKWVRFVPEILLAVVIGTSKSNPYSRLVTADTGSCHGYLPTR